MAKPEVRRAWREMMDPERAAWARMQARWVSVALKRKQRFTVVVHKETKP